MNIMYMYMCMYIYICMPACRQLRLSPGCCRSRRPSGSPWGLDVILCVGFPFMRDFPS